MSSLAVQLTTTLRQAADPVLRRNHQQAQVNRLAFTNITSLDSLNPRPGLAIVRDEAIQKKTHSTAQLSGSIDKIFRNLGAPNWKLHLSGLRQIGPLLEKLTAIQPAKPYELEKPIVERLIALRIHNPHFELRQEAALTLSALIVDLDDRFPLDEKHSLLLQDLRARIRNLPSVYNSREPIQLG